MKSVVLTKKKKREYFMPNLFQSNMLVLLIAFILKYAINSGGASTMATALNVYTDFSLR